MTIDNHKCDGEARRPGRGARIGVAICVVLAGFPATRTRADVETDVRRASAAPGANAETKPHARARVFARPRALVPGAETQIAIAFEIDPGWHLYWNGRNDTGLPIQVDPDLPNGLSAGTMRWPVPERHVSPGNILDHVYEKQATLILPIETSEDARPGDRLDLGFGLDWVVCQEACVYESDSLAIELPVVEPDAVPDELPEAEVRLWNEAWSRLPRPISESPVPVSIDWKDGRVRIRREGARGLCFFPGPDCAELVDPIPSTCADSDRLALGFESGPEAGRRRLQGILEVRDSSRNATYYEFDRTWDKDP